MRPSLLPYLFEKNGFILITLCNVKTTAQLFVKQPADHFLIEKTKTSWKLIFKTQTLTGIWRRNTLFYQNIMPESFAEAKM